MSGKDTEKELASIIIWRFDDQHVDDDNQIKGSFQRDQRSKGKAEAQAQGQYHHNFTCVASFPLRFSVFGSASILGELRIGSDRIYLRWDPTIDA